MNYLLVSTKNDNLGDKSVCCGIQNLISCIDPEASFLIINKEDKKEWEYIYSADKVIWCGMPLFWSYGGDTNTTIFWWELLENLCFLYQKNFLILGAGSFAPWKEEVQTLENKRELVSSAKFLKENSFKVTIRDRTVNMITEQNFEVLPCPSIFSVLDKQPKIKLVNIMPCGSHYSIFNKSQSKNWVENSKYVVVEHCLQNDYTFIAHNSIEEVEGKSLGFTNILYPKIIEEFVNIYSFCSFYIGNRIHGAILTKASQGKSLCVGYDSRLTCVQDLFGEVRFPTQISKTALLNFENSDQKNPDLSPSKQRYLQILKEFLHGEK